MGSPPALPSPTYAFIPPPPLPEFYLKPSKVKNTSSSSSAPPAAISQASAKTKTKVTVSKQSRQEQANDVAQYIANQAQPCPTIAQDATDERKMVTFEVPRAAVMMPPPPPGYTNIVPPLAVYHICRICLRPRSARYHREHPIPINGVPPPPGICRRCRVLKVEDVTKETEVIQREAEEIEIVRMSESKKIKLGVFHGIDDDDYVSREEWEARRVRKLMKEAKRQHGNEERSESSESERDIVYRHVRVQQKVDCPTRAEQVATNVLPCLPKPKVSVYSTAQDAIDQVSSHSQERLAANTRPWPTPILPIVSIPVVGAEASAATVKVKTGIDKDGIVKASASARTGSPSASARSQSTTKVKAEVTNYVLKPERFESDIRRIAREEVVKYRQAERKIESHPDPYAHGRMVQVARHISPQANAERQMPRRTETLEVRVEREKRPSRSPMHVSHHSHRGRPSSRADVLTAPPGIPAELYTSSGWSKSRSSSSSNSTNGHEVVIERVLDHSAQVPGRLVRSASQRDEGGRQRETGHSTVKSSTIEQRSATSERTTWVRTRGGPPLASIAESDPCGSVKRTTVVGLDGEQLFRTVRDSSLPRPSRYNVVEVVEDINMSRDSGQQRRNNDSRTGSRIPEHVRELQEAAICKEAAENPKSRIQATVSERSTRPTDREYWRDGSASYTPSDRASANQDIRFRYVHEYGQDDVTRWPVAASPRSARSEKTRQQETLFPENPLRGGSTRGSDRRMAAPTEVEQTRSSVCDFIPQETRRSVSGRASERPSAPAGSAGRSRSSRQPEYEWTHVERTVQPADVPWERDPFEHRQSEYYVETEELQRNRGHYGTAVQASRPVSRPETQVQASTRSYQNPRSPSERRFQRQEAKVSPSEGSNARVRFANKVEFSPTPPGSEASSAQFRIIGPQSRSRTKGRLNGSGQESAEDLIAEYERRGRARARGRRSPQGKERYLDGTQKASERQKGWRDSRRPRSFDGAAEEMPPSVIADPKYRPLRSKPLTTALSESPSRECLREGSSANQAVQRSKLDGHGPYRPEAPRAESMEVGEGSRHSVPREGHGYPHSYWSEEQPGGAVW
ncbi:hypothetical protein B0A50_01761 [Salinomyces thailandicus]|uniref:Uncharacterized protein n=1 Tax=Salinomyces thailandicus TaxID=706561 RepID=A0A4U0U8P7_9PEZI|nr:hypothetical protein B0A50_01761 [Salinomyces thailandica]